MGIKNFIKLSVYAAVVLLFLSMLTGCLSAGVKSEVTLKETEIGEVLTIEGEEYSVDGRFYVYVMADVVHPSFAHIKNNMDEALKYGLALNYVQHAIHIVVRRDNEIVFAAGDSLNSTNCFLTNYKDTNYDAKQKKLLNAGFAFFIPNEYRDDDLRLVMTDVYNFGCSITTIDGVSSTEYTQPEDVLFEYNVK